MSKKVLFLCTGNSARSQMAEAILNAKEGDRFIAYSAGTNPEKEINPLAVKVMDRAGIDISNKRPKSYEIFANEEFDFVITLCNKGKEQCISYIGRPIFAHWDFPDPADFKGTEIEKLRQFEEIFQQITTRVNLLCSIPIDKLDRKAIELKTSEISNTSCNI